MLYALIHTLIRRVLPVTSAVKVRITIFFPIRYICSFACFMHTRASKKTFRSMASLLSMLWHFG